MGYLGINGEAALSRWQAVDGMAHCEVEVEVVL